MSTSIDSKILLILRVCSAIVRSKGADVKVENSVWNEVSLLRLIKETKTQCDREDRMVESIDKLYYQFESKISALN